MYRTDFWSLREKARVGLSERTASKLVYYQVWNRLPLQVGCMRQVLGPGALGRPREIGWRGRWEGGSGWGTHVNPWLIHVNVWQKALQYCKVISHQLIKINGKKIHIFGAYCRILGKSCGLKGNWVLGHIGSVFLTLVLPQKHKEDFIKYEQLDPQPQRVWSCTSENNPENLPLWQVFKWPGTLLWEPLT